MAGFGHEVIQNANYVMGDTACELTVLDVAELLQNRFAFISGGKSRNGCPIITFPDNPKLTEVSEQQYKDVVTYLVSVPTLTDAKLGFVLLIDRRNNKWTSVKTMLLKLASFFPSGISEVLVLRPNGFFSNLATDMGFKIVKDEYNFQVVLLNSVTELHDRIDADQLTSDLNGTIVFDHKEWIQHRAAVEKFAANVSSLSTVRLDLVQKHSEIEMPNDVESTEAQIQEHAAEKVVITEDLKGCRDHGDTLKTCIGPQRRLNPKPCVSADSHISAINRLLDQLAEIERGFSEIWSKYEEKLHQSLELRQFEEVFKQVQFVVDRHFESLEKIADSGDSLPHVQQLIKQMTEIEASAQPDLARAQQLQDKGEKFVAGAFYGVDSIKPKCAELHRLCQQCHHTIDSKKTTLGKSKELHERIDRANKWCTKGVDLLAQQQIDRVQTKEGAERALKDLDEFLATAKDLNLSHPREFRQMFDTVMTPDTKTTVQQVLKRMEDVQGMYEKRLASLKKLSMKAPRPVQPVHPEQMSTKLSSDLVNRLSSNAKTSATSSNELKRKRKEEESKKIIQIVRDDESPAPYLSPSHDATDLTTLTRKHSLDTLSAKRGHVMNELIETERIYVSQLESVIRGYIEPMSNPANFHLMPDNFAKRIDTLFGNLQEIYHFHRDYFLRDLESYQNTPSLVGTCFVQRKEQFQIYSKYCQNKPFSEALRREVGDNNPFFKTCQKNLGHRLPLGAYLLKPVQRITKYQLLLKEMLKYTGDEVGGTELREALESMLSVLKYVNDLMHQVAITGFQGNVAEQGRLLMQGAFHVWTEHKETKIKDLRFKPMQRHVFLYEKLIMFCKKKDDQQNAENVSYIFKNALKTAHIGLTEGLKNDPKKFEVWLHGRVEVFTLQASTEAIKTAWVKQIKKVLMTQYEAMKAVGSSRQNSSASLTSQISQRSLQWTEETSTNTSVIQNPSEERSVVSSDDGWSSDEFSNTDDDLRLNQDNDSSQSLSSQEQQTTEGNEETDGALSTYQVLADYNRMDASEVCLKEGDTVEVTTVGDAGWWYVKVNRTQAVGWAPASYLEPVKASDSNNSIDSAVGSKTSLSGGVNKNYFPPEESMV